MPCLAKRLFESIAIDPQDLTLPRNSSTEPLPDTSGKFRTERWDREDTETVLNQGQQPSLCAVSQISLFARDTFS
jgi:hypothetical protein